MLALSPQGVDNLTLVVLRQERGAEFRSAQATGRRHAGVGGVAAAGMAQHGVIALAGIHPHAGDQLLPAVATRLGHDQRILEQAHLRDQLQPAETCLTKDQQWAAAGAAELLGSTRLQMWRWSEALPIVDAGREELLAQGGLQSGVGPWLLNDLVRNMLKSAAREDLSAVA
jgi:hypothetical protein